MERARVEYTGRVQGVGFRATAAHLASRHPVTGWVRNNPDGSVSLECQGERAAVDAYLDDLAQRMGRKIVTAARSEADPLPDEPGFTIRR